MNFFFGNIKGDDALANNEGSDPINFFLKENDLDEVLESIMDEKENMHELPSEAEAQNVEAKQSLTYSSHTGYPQRYEQEKSNEPPLLISGGDVDTYNESTWVTQPLSSMMSTLLPDNKTPSEAPFLAGHSAVDVSERMPVVTTPMTSTLNSISTPLVGDAVRLTVRNNVYVSELPAHWNTDKVRSVCGAFGNIISAKVVHDRTTNKSREYGFVMFETEEQASLCVKSLNDYTVDGRVLTCRLAHQRAMPSFAHSESRHWSPSTTTTTTANVTPQTTSVTPQECTLEATSLSNVEPTEGSRASVHETQPRQQQQQQQQHGGSRGTADQRASPSLRKSRNVFIQGLPLHWNTDKLRSLCGTCGKVLLAKVVRDATTSLSCGHGFVLFDTEEQALACVDSFNGVFIEGRTLTCRLAREKCHGSQSSAPTLPTCSNANTTTTTSNNNTALASNAIPINANVMNSGTPPSGLTSLGAESLVTPPANVMTPIRVVATPPSAALVPVATNYAKWPPLQNVQNLQNIQNIQNIQNAYIVALPFTPAELRQCSSTTSAVIVPTAGNTSAPGRPPGVFVDPMGAYIAHP